MDTETTVYERDPFENAIYIFKYWVSVQEEVPVAYDETPSRFSVKPLDDRGFEVSIERIEDELIVSTEHWHCHVDDAVQAASVAFWLFTPFTRVVFELKGGHPWASWIENYRLDQWVGTDFIYFADPRLDESWELKPGEVFERNTLQQDVLRWRKPIEEVCPGIQLDSAELPPDSFIGHLRTESLTSTANRIKLDAL